MIINISRPGRVGNQLFLYAHLLAFSQETHHTFVNPAFDYSKYFQGTHSHFHHLLPNFFPLISSIGFRSTQLPINSRIQLIHLNSNQKLNLDTTSSKKIFSTHTLNFTQGWLFRGPRTVKKHSSYLRDYFKLTSFYQIQLDQVTPSNKETLLFGIHARRGDYRHFHQGKYFYTWKQYHSIIKNLRKQFVDCKFILVSDESVPASIAQTKDITLPKASPVIDMYALSKCDYILGPPSSFSMWASFIGQKPLFMLHQPKPPQSLKQFQINSG